MLDIKWQGMYYRVLEEELELELSDNVPIYRLQERTRFLWWTWWSYCTYWYHTEQYDSELELSDAVRRAQELDSKKRFNY